jgi:hypothetical protein
MTNKDEKQIKSGEQTYFTDLPPRDSDTGLVADTGVYDEKQEKKRRMHAEGMAHYAEEGDHFDPAGLYLCGGKTGDGVGGCNQYRPGSHKCLSVAGKIDGDCGSCAWWEKYIEPPGHSDLDLGPEKFHKSEALYGEREPGGTGWSCSNCEYGSFAKQKDSEGRSIFCGIWGARVQPLACCGRNHQLGDTVFKDNQPLTQLEFYKNN